MRLKQLKLKKRSDLTLGAENCHALVASWTLGTCWTRAKGSWRPVRLGTLVDSSCRTLSSCVCELEKEAESAWPMGNTWKVPERFHERWWWCDETRRHGNNTLRPGASTTCCETTVCVCVCSLPLMNPVFSRSRSGADLRCDLSQQSLSGFLRLTL